MEFALLLVLQLFFLLVVIQFMIICVADSINTYSSFVGARAQAVHKSPQLASAFWVMRVYNAPMWRIPPLVTSPDESSVVSRYSVPLEMAGEIRDAIREVSNLRLRRPAVLFVTSDLFCQHSHFSLSLS